MLSLLFLLPLSPLPVQTRSAPAPCGPTFTVRFAREARAEPFTGRVLVLLSKDEPEPRLAQGGPRLEPVAARDVVGLEPEEPVGIGAGALAFPVLLPDLERGRYRAQALLDAAPDAPFPCTAPGNVYSDPVEFEFHGAESVAVALTCARVVPELERVETRTARIVEVPSRLLSQFHGREVRLRALVHLPEAWFEESDRRFPVHVFLSGFGATLEGFTLPHWPAPVVGGVPMLCVYPDPSCASGHSGFADSENEGPWGRALVEELLPAVEAGYRGLGERDARVLVGHSSGAWGALWLMLHHPDAFGSCWANSPDPLDFRDFMGIDLYAPDANVFRDASGRPRPFAVLDQEWTIGTFRAQSEREAVLRGGPLVYFEAVLGPRGADGRPARLWDRVTGAVDPAVARAWARQDLSLVLRERWTELAPLLAGRISITVGNRDNYLLRGSVERFASELDALGGGLRVRVMPGDHFSVRSYEQALEEVDGLLAPYRAWAARADR